MNKETESAKLLESLESRIKAALSRILDIRYSISEMEDDINEIADIAEKLKDVFAAEDE